MKNELLQLGVTEPSDWKSWVDDAIKGGTDLKQIIHQVMIRSNGCCNPAKIAEYAKSKLQ